MATVNAQIFGYLPQEQWPTLEAMADGFDEHLMPPSTKLVKWRVLEGDDAGAGEAEYKAYEVSSGIFMVDFYKESHKQLVTLLLNTTTGQVKACISGFTDKSGERRTCTSFIDAVKEGDRPLAALDPTDELVGKHCLYRYTPRDAYQHFYCNMWKLSERLYLFFWTETVMPVESIVVIDLHEMRSTGRFLYWDPKPQSVVHVRFGSQATVLNEVDIAAELAKPLRS